MNQVVFTELERGELLDQFSAWKGRIIQAPDNTRIVRVPSDEADFSKRVTRQIRTHEVPLRVFRFSNGREFLLAFDFLYGDNGALVVANITAIIPTHPAV